MTSRVRTGALIAAPVALLGLLSACSGGDSSGNDIAIYVSAPVSTAPWIATAERNGAELAAEQLNADGGIDYAGHKHHVVITVRDNGGSPQRAAGDARAAVSAHAAALIIDGVGAGAVGAIAKPASMPVFVVFDGGASVIDAKTRPTLFRMAPADRPMAVRLADYLADKHPHAGVITDDTSYGADGAVALREGFARDRIPIVSRATVPASSDDVSTQVLGARRAHASMLVVWAGAPVVAAATEAARSAGWQVPIWAGPAGEDPLVRQRLAQHPQWLQGVGFVSFRITAEVGPKPFQTYRSAYEQKFGVDKVGVKQDGKDVLQPPDWSMYSYDTVRLVAAGLQKAGSIGPALLQTLEGHVVITGANGDERGFSETTREGVSPDDMYFALFHGFVFQPVTNDLLSQNLPAVPQLG